jgi:hypothetical protein
MNPAKMADTASAKTKEIHTPLDLRNLLKSNASV